MARLPARAGPFRPPARSSLRRRLGARIRLSLLAASVAVPMLAPSPAPAAKAGAETGLPVPRFVSLRSNEVNLRTGPGTNYPVEWVYVRRHMPVEIVAEFDTWRKIRDWQGTVGWVHQSLLDGQRTGIVVGTVRDMLSAPQADAARTVARLEPGVIVRLRECRPDWCLVRVQEFEGWLPRDAFWGLYPGETFD